MTPPKNLKGDAIGQNAVDASLQLDSSPPLHKQVIGHTNIGSGREKNQDAASAYFISQDKTPRFILTLADGLGYYHHSEKAAYYAVTRIPVELSKGKNLVSSCGELHAELGKEAEKDEKNNEGSTTVVLADIIGDKATIANIGDSRCYLIRNRKIVYQTRDQTVLELMVTQGLKFDDPGFFRRHPLRNVLLNALGTPEPIYQFEESGKIVHKKTGSPAIDQLDLRKGDFLLLVSDGVYANLYDEELVGIINSETWENLEDHLHTSLQGILISGKTHFNEPSNPDNYTFIIYRHV